MSSEIRWVDKPFAGYHLAEMPGEDEELTHIDPGSPCGEYMRRFWHPVAMASQLGERPEAIRILGEDLVIFRDLSGDVGLVHKHCAHRRMSLEYGKIEQHGIRCAYHGWQFAINGEILDTPGEPAESSIRKNVCLGAYPTIEMKGLIFAYLGPPETKPAFPYLDSMDIDGHDMVPYSIHSPCNWLQESENSIDPIHSVFLHGRINGPQFPGLENFVELPVVEYHSIPTGFMYSHARRVDDLVWIRFHDHLTPNFAQNGGMFQSYSQPTFFGRPSLSKWVVPIDNTNSRKFGWRHFNDSNEVLRRGERAEVGWESVDFYGQSRHRSREEMLNNPGDWEAWTSQGPINVHKREYLGSTDKGVTMLRNRIRKHIRTIAKGKSIEGLNGTKDKPLHTYGGDTVLRIPKSSEDEKQFLSDMQKKVADIYFEGDKYEGNDRIEFLQKTLEALSQ
jgi:phenylpropionate dioxygenase-like ring-hydroxylating dioxygenase large terminal subunit